MKANNFPLTIVHSWLFKKPSLTLFFESCFFSLFYVDNKSLLNLILKLYFSFHFKMYHMKYYFAIFSYYCSFHDNRQKSSKNSVIFFSYHAKFLFFSLYSTLSRPTAEMIKSTRLIIFIQVSQAKNNTIISCPLTTDQLHEKLFSWC